MNALHVKLIILLIFELYSSVSTQSPNYFHCIRSKPWDNGNLTSLIRQKHRILNQTELNQFKTLEKIFSIAFNCENGLQIKPTNNYTDSFDGRTFSYVTDILMTVAETVGFNNLYNSMKNGISTAVTCLACQGIMNLLVVSLISKQTLAFAIIEVCATLKLSTPRVCNGIVDSFKDQVDYIRLNTKLSPNEMCGVLLGVQCAIGQSDNLYWKISVPKTANNERDSSTNNRYREHNKDYSILHVTDIHIDPLYREGTVSHCGEPLCCRLSSGIDNGRHGSGVWGAYPCDIPHHTVDNGLKNARQEAQRLNANLWYWTGDAVAHDIWRYKKESNLLASETISSLLKQLQYNGVQIIPAIGNHETVPVNSFPPPEINNEFSLSWLYNSLAEQWSDWLPTQALETLKMFGSYSIVIRPGFRIITINTNYCARLNIWSLYDPIDPADHLLWLIEELEKAEQANDSVHIVGHVPPDNRECTQAWVYNFLSIIERFKHIIVGQFYGHTHADEFRVLYSNRNYSQPIGFEILSPSLTTFEEFNPTFRIYKTDSRGHIKDFNTYSFKLTEANKNMLNRAPNWYFEYSMANRYSINDFSYNGWNSFVQKLISDESVLDKYYRAYYRDSDAIPAPKCDRSCKLKLITDIIITNPYEILPKPIWSTG